MTTTEQTPAPRAVEPLADGCAADRPAAPNASEADEAVLVEDDLLVEDISIDGMCGVY